MVDLILDYGWGRLSSHDVISRGYRGIARYLSDDPTKNLTLGEVADMRRNGLLVYAVWETTAGRPLSGRNGAQEDGPKMVDLARSLGWNPGHGTLYAAMDDDTRSMASGEWGRIEAYFDRMQDYASGALGVYGGYSTVKNLLDQGIVGRAWQTSGWSDGRWDPRADLQQYAYGVMVRGVQVDVNRVMHHGTDMFGVTPTNRYAGFPVCALHSIDPSFCSGLANRECPVTALQNALNIIGHAETAMSEKQHLTPDGVFGPKTETRVRNFQRFFRIPDDGIVGPRTWETLDTILDAMGR